MISHFEEKNLFSVLVIVVWVGGELLLFSFSKLNIPFKQVKQLSVTSGLDGIRSLRRNVESIHNTIPRRNVYLSSKQKSLNLTIST